MSHDLKYSALLKLSGKICTPRKIFEPLVGTLTHTPILSRKHRFFGVKVFGVSFDSAQTRHQRRRLSTLCTNVHNVRKCTVHLH